MGQRKERETLLTSAMTDDERRAARRHDAMALGPVVARLIGGSEVRLLDFSRRGVLLESEARLLIGAKATIKITTTDGALTVRGCVVRSRVAGVQNGVLVYHTALALEEDLASLEEAALARNRPSSDPPLAAGADGLRLAGELLAEAPATALHQTSGDSPGSEDAYSAAPGRDAGASDAVLEFLATVPHDLAELRRRAAVNNW